MSTTHAQEASNSLMQSIYCNSNPLVYKNSCNEFIFIKIYVEIRWNKWQLNKFLHKQVELSIYMKLNKNVAIDMYVHILNMRHNINIYKKFHYSAKSKTNRKLMHINVSINLLFTDYNSYVYMQRRDKRQFYCGTENHEHNGLVEWKVIIIFTQEI